MFIETLSQSFRQARSVDQTSAAFVSKVPIAGLLPLGDANNGTGSAIIEAGSLIGVTAQNKLNIVPFGTGADDSTFSVRVICWRKFGNDALTWIWVPVNLVELLCTICTVPGVAGTLVDGTHNFCDTIVVTTGSALGGELANESINSPGNNTIAHAVIDMKGAQFIELSFSTGNSATAANALLSMF